MMRRGFWLLVLALVIAGGGWLVWQRTHTKGPTGQHAAPSVPITVAPVATRDVADWLEGIGTVAAFNSVTVHSMISGPLIAVPFQEGDEVAAGTVLARIDPRPYQAALDQAVAKKAQDEAALANARLDEARYARLVTQNYTSAQQADTARALVAQDTALVQQDSAQIETARTNLSYTTIRAPISGRLGIRQVDAGNIIHSTDTNGLVVITQLQPISVIFTLPQQDLPQVQAAIRAGKPVVEAWSQGEGAAQATRLDRGVLAVLDNQVDSATGTIKLKATFPNQAQLLWPGGFVSVRLLARTLKQALTVPPVAVQRGPAGDFVYTVSAGKAVRRNVEIGYEDVAVAVVTKGLSAGQSVVTDGASRLSEGSLVHIVTQPATAGQAGSPAKTGTSGQNGGG